MLEKAVWRKEDQNLKLCVHTHWIQQTKKQYQTKEEEIKNKSSWKDYDMGEREVCKKCKQW